MGKKHTDDITGPCAVNSGTGEEEQNLYYRSSQAAIANIFLNGIRFSNQNKMSKNYSGDQEIQGSGEKTLDLRVFSVMLTPGPSIS